jgi:hypothetical protein
MATQKSRNSKAQPVAWFEIVGTDVSAYSRFTRASSDGRRRKWHPAATTA